MNRYSAILFDLDDTLLGNPMERFMPAYFGLLTKYVEPLVSDRHQFLAWLVQGTQAMIANPDRTRSNREVFWAYFSEQAQLDAGETERFVNGFYRDVFGQLQPVTEARPEAEPFVRECLANGLAVVIATNPLFPRSAIEQRLAWAGLPVEEFPFSLITTYENMHAAKPHVAYYEEILARIGVQPQAVIMVGDDWQNDIVPANALGLDAFWIAEGDANPPDPSLLVGWGSLGECRAFLSGVSADPGRA